MYKVVTLFVCLFSFVHRRLRDISPLVVLRCNVSVLLHLPLCADRCCLVTIVLSDRAAWPWHWQGYQTSKFYWWHWWKRRNMEGRHVRLLLQYLQQEPMIKILMYHGFYPFYSVSPTLSSQTSIWQFPMKPMIKNRQHNHIYISVMYLLRRKTITFKISLKIKTWTPAE